MSGSNALNSTRSTATGNITKGLRAHINNSVNGLPQSRLYQHDNSRAPSFAGPSSVTADITNMINDPMYKLLMSDINPKDFRAQI